MGVLHVTEQVRPTEAVWQQTELARSTFSDPSFVLQSDCGV